MSSPGPPCSPWSTRIIGTPIAGRVTGIGWGTRSSEELQFMGMPLVANKLDWVRTARRYPVEIELEDAPEG